VLPQPSIKSGNRLGFLAAMLDVRIILLIACLALLFLPRLNFTYSEKLDSGFFSLGMLLQRGPVDSSAYVCIDVASDEVERFLHDPANAIELINALEQLQQTFTRGTALVFHEPVWRQYVSQDFLLAHWHEVSTGSQPETEKALAEISARMRVFISVLTNPKYVFATPQIMSFSPPSIQAELYKNGTSAIGDILQPTLPITTSQSGNKISSTSPLADNSSLYRPMLWQSDDVLRPDARLELYMHKQGLRNPTWIPGQGFKWPDHFFRTSFNGVIYPWFTTGMSGAPQLQHFTLSQLSKQDIRRVLHEKTIVIAQQGDSVADDLLYTVLSMDGGYYAITPNWLPLCRIAIILSIMLLVLSSAYCSMRLFSILNFIAMLSLLLTQQIFLLLHRVWLPFSDCIFLLLFCYSVLMLMKIRREFYPLAVDMQREHEQPTKKAAMAPTNVIIQRTSSNIPKLSLFEKILGRSKASVKNRNRFLDDDEETLFDTGAKEPAVRGTSPVAAQKQQRQFLGRYQVQRELGRGAMGVVYLGFDPKISRQVAIKTLHYTQFDSSELASVKDRFFREAEAAGRLRHPNIVTIYDAGEESDLAYIAMDYVSGDTLAAHVRKHELLDVELVYWIMMNVSDAVAYANSQGIIHRDLKPSNILFDEKTNEVKVADFGIARIMDSTVSRTKTGDILGSPLYMAPEQLKGEPVSPRSDVFSLGVTFYQLLTGELPFKGNNIHELSLQIVQAKFKPIDEIRPELPDSARLIINKALQKNPEKRYNTAAEMAEALNRAYSKEFT
jgi:serine/threonine-protein kinase